MKKIIIVGIAFLSFTLQTFAQDTNRKNEFALDVQNRSRAEYRHGALFPRSEGDVASSFINNRARMSMLYKRDSMMIKFSAQHVGVWGQDPSIDKNGRFALNEAWARLNLTTNLFAQIGRQPLAYDDERILGGLDWNVAGRYHDALKLGFESGSHKVHAVLAFNQNDEKLIGGTYYDVSSTGLYKNMQMLWYNYSPIQSPFQGSLILINLGQEGGDAAKKQSDTRYLQTVGTNFTYKKGDLKLNGSFYYQTGKDKTDRAVSAYMASVQTNYQYTSTVKFNLGLDYLSGSKATDSQNKAFNPLYGSHHMYYGSMDYFYASPFLTPYNPGLVDINVGVGATIHPKIAMSLQYHYFATGVKLDAAKRTLGSEVDYQLSYKVMRDVNLLAGYSFMLGTSTMDKVKGGNYHSWQDWGWLSLTISPRIFFSRW